MHRSHTTKLNSTAQGAKNAKGCRRKLFSHRPASDESDACHHPTRLSGFSAFSDACEAQLRHSIGGEDG
jgi:hypothetical protein